MISEEWKGDRYHTENLDLLLLKTFCNQSLMCVHEMARQGLKEAEILQILQDSFSDDSEVGGDSDAEDSRIHPEPTIEHQKDGTMYVMPVVTESLQYIANLVSHQKETTVCNKTTNLRKKCTRNLIIPANLQHKLLTFVSCHPKGIPIKVLENEVLLKFPCILQGFMNTEEVLEHASHILRVSKGCVYPTCGGKNYKNDENRSCSVENMHIENENDCHMLPDTIIRNIKLLMKEYPNGILAAEFSSIYEKKFRTTFNIQKYGYTTILSVASAYPNVLHCFRVSDADFLLIETPGDLEENVLEKKNLKDMIEWLIAQFPDGLKVDQLEEAFQVHFLRSLQPTQFGYNNVDDLLHELEMDSLVTVKTVKSIKIIYPAGFSTAADIYMKNEENCEDSGAEFDSIFTASYPTGVLLPSDDIQLQQLQSSSPDPTFEIVVSHAVSPSKFWVVLNYNDNCSALDQLIDKLQSFYMVYNSDYVMPEPTICIGQYCVCPYKGKWYRAQIKNIVTDSEVQVHLIDIGVMAKKNKSHLRFMAQEFADLPSQALCCHLAGVPTGQTVWPNEIRQSFVEAVLGRAFTATLISTNEDGELCIELCGEADDGTIINISNWLETLETMINSQPEEMGNFIKKQSLEDQLQKFTCI